MSTSAQLRGCLDQDLASLFFSPSGLKISVTTMLCQISSLFRNFSLLSFFLFIGAGGAGAALYIL